MIEPHYPASGWIRLHADTLRRAAPAGGRARAALAGGLRRRRCSPSGGGCREPPRDALSRSCVDSLLLEGYALYPYTPGATKNATPTPFGIVYPPAYAAARRRPSTTCRLPVPGPPAPSAALSAEVRFLQAERRAATGRPSGGSALAGPGDAPVTAAALGGREVALAVAEREPGLAA